MSDSDVKLFDGKALYGKPYLKDILIRPGKPTLISSVTIKSKKDDLIYILATGYNVYPVKNTYFFSLSYNGKVIYSKKTNNFEYFTSLKAEAEISLFSLFVSSDYYSCLCPTIGTGYNSGYQVAAWKKTTTIMKKII